MLIPDPEVMQMGSIGCERPKGMTDKAFFQQEYPSFDVLAASRVSGTVYAAFRKPDSGEVFAFVSPVSGRAGDGYEFVYKMQDETMGPYYDVACPAKILDLLTPTDDEYANEWRKRCREHAVMAAAAKERAKCVVAGTVIRTSEPCYFGKRYGTYSTFKYMGKGSTFVALDEDGNYALSVSLTKWKERDYEVVS